MSDTPQTSSNPSSETPVVDPVVCAPTVHSQIQSQLTAKYCDEKQVKQIRKQIQALHVLTEANTSASQGSADVSDAEQPDATLLATIDSDMEKLREKLHQEIAQREAAFAKVVDATDKLEQDVEAGKVAEALKVRDDIQSQLHNIYGLSDRRRESIELRLKAMEPRLNELRGWRKWGTTQAREQLIGDIEKLFESKEHPKVIAQQVQTARETWKAWDKNGEGANKDLWDKFNSTCTQAYEPCRVFFEKQEHERQENLKKRQAVVTRMNELFEATDWEAPDWRRLDKKLRDVRTQWRQIGPVPGKQRKPTEEAFEKAMASFEPLMTSERNRSLRSRRNLVTTVVALAEETDMRKAIETAKNAQQEWKPTVLATNKQERELWQEFRAACDAVFTRRDEQRKANDEKFKQTIGEREKICTQMEALLASGGGVSSGRAKALTQQWNDLDHVPRKLAAKTDQRFRDLSTKLTTSKIIIEHERSEQRLSTLHTLAGVCTGLESTLLDAGRLNTDEVSSAKRSWALIIDGDSSTAGQAPTTPDTGPVDEKPDTAIEEKSVAPTQDDANLEQQATPQAATDTVADTPEDVGEKMPGAPEVEATKDTTGEEKNSDPAMTQDTPVAEQTPDTDTTKKTPVAENNTDPNDTAAPPFDVPAAIDQRFNNACLAATDQTTLTALQTASAEGLQAQRDICLQLEIRAEIDSPGEYQRERMALQVDRLAAAMGGASSSQRRTNQQSKAQSDLKDKSTESLMIDFYAMATLGTVDRLAIQQRFERAAQALKEQRQAQVEKRVQQSKQRAQRERDSNQNNRGRRPQRSRPRRSSKDRANDNSSRGRGNGSRSNRQSRSN